MLLLITLLSFVAIHYYRDKKDRDSMHHLNETFASTTNLTDQLYVENLRSVELESDCSELPSVFIDTDMNGDVYYTNRNSVGHLKHSMITKCGSRSPTSFLGDVQYPALVHPSEPRSRKKKTGQVKQTEGHEPRQTQTPATDTWNNYWNQRGIYPCRRARTWKLPHELTWWTIFFSLK